MDNNEYCKKLNCQAKSKIVNALQSQLILQLGLAHKQHGTQTRPKRLAQLVNELTKVLIFSGKSTRVSRW